MIVTTSDVLRLLAEISNEKYGEENKLVEELDKKLLTEELKEEQDKEAISSLKKELKNAEKKSFIIYPDTWKGTFRSRYDAWNKNNFIVETRSSIQITLDLNKGGLEKVCGYLMEKLESENLEYKDYRVRSDYIIISKYEMIKDDLEDSEN